MSRDVLALVQAGGTGGRMDVLTRERAKPALPFGGVHRLIDFPLSMFVHAEVRDVWVSVEYQVASIDQYLSGGRPWDLDSGRGGFRRMVPQTGSGPATEEAFAHGNGDLLLRLARHIESHGATTLVVSSADHVFSADLDPVIAEHRASGLAATVLTAEVSHDEARNNVTVAVEDGRVTALEEKPEDPSTGTVLTELFVYEVAPLLDTLRSLRTELAADPGMADDLASGDSGIGDFGDHLLPRFIDQGQVRAVPLHGYWRDLGRPSAYLAGHRDLLAGKIDTLNNPRLPVISKWQDRTAARVRAGAVLEDSIISPGCDIAGEVVRSVLGPGVLVEPGARIEDSVVFHDAVVRRGARVTTAVLDERCDIGPRATVGGTDPGRPIEDEEVTLLGMDSVVGEGVEVGGGGRLEPGTTA